MQNEIELFVGESPFYTFETMQMNCAQALFVYFFSQTVFVFSSQ